MTEIQRIDPLSPIQEGLLYHSIQDDHQHGTYIEQYIVNIRGKFKANVFSYALHEITKYHDVIRASFVYENVDRPARIIWAETEIPFRYEDLRQLTYSDRLNIIEQSRTTEHLKSFIVTEGTLIRVTVFITGDDSFCMLWSYHHLLMDGYSFQIFLNRYLQTYECMLENKLVPHTINATDDHYVQWLSSLNWDAASDYWSSYLHGYDTHHLLPRKRKLSVDGEEDRKTIEAVFDEQTTIFLRELGIQNRASLNTVLQTLWAIMLQRYTNSSDVIYGLVTSLRNPVIPDIEHALGVYINTIPVRVQAYENMTVVELLQNMQQQSLSSNEHSYYPLQQIQAENSIKKDLINHILIFTNVTSDTVENELAAKLNQELEVLCIEKIAYFTKTHYPLQLDFTSSPDHLKLNIEYDETVYGSHFIHAIPGHFKTIIKTIMTAGNIRLHELDLLTSEEKHRILNEFNMSQVKELKWQSIYAMFEHQVFLQPDYVAIDGPNGSLSYRELYEKANYSASILQCREFSKGDVVGLLYHRSEAFVIQALAVLKAGLRYVPLDPEAPLDRNLYILSDSGAKLLLTEQSLGELYNLENMDCHVLQIDVKEDERYVPTEQHSNEITAGDGAYIIYTSGTTGRPKGVEVQHQSVIHLIEDLADELYTAINGRLRVAQFAPFFFDQSIEEIFGTLLLGHTLIIATEAIRLDKHKTLEFLEQYDIDMMNGTPSYMRALLLQNEKKPALKRILVGGESIPYPLLTEILDTLDPTVELFNVYGPTECCVDATYYKVELTEIERLHVAPIGKPMRSKQVYILDEYQRIQPLGVDGEIIIGGPGVAAGYKNLPDMNTASFVKDPFHPQQQAYRTGDKGRWLPDGKIEFLGRNDRLVKLHGYRIELEEVEERLLAIVGVREAVVILKQVEDRKFLCAFIILEKGEFMSTHELKEKLAASLPHYMIPATVHFMSELPVSATGKIDRKALLHIETELEANMEPASPFEGQIVSLWEEVLHIDNIQPQDHFFELGGHSLYATMLIAKVNQEFNVRITIKQLFLYPTVTEFAKLIERSPKNTMLDEKVSFDDKQTEFPMTSSQMRLYLLQQRNGASTEYNISGRFRIQGKLEIHRIEACLATLIEQNEMLRTSFQAKKDGILQKIHPPMSMHLKIFNKEPDDNEWIQPFDLNTAPLFRIYALRVGHDQFDLLIDMHHIITDGISNSLLVQQFNQLYAGENILSTSMPYKHYAHWQKQYITSPERHVDECYWLERLAGELPECGILPDFPRKNQSAPEAQTVWIEINEQLTSSLQQLAQRHDASLFSVLLAAYNVLMYKYSGQEDVVVGSTVSGRTHHDVQNTIGLFVNTIVLRHFPSGNKPFSSFVSEVASHVLDDLEHQNYPFDVLLDQLAVFRSIERNPVFDIMFVMQNLTHYEDDTLGKTFGSELVVEKSKSKFDLLVEINEYTSRLTIKFEYNQGLYHRETIERCAQYYLHLLEEIAIFPEKMLDDFTVIRPEEAQKLISGYDRSQVAYPVQKTIHSLFEEQVTRTPHHVALSDGDHSLTYQQLDQAANQLAHYLQKQGIKAGMVVGVAMERSVDAVIAIMAILKTGSAYLSLDRQLPEERLSYIILHSQAQLVITDALSFFADVEEISKRIIYLAANQADVAQESVLRPNIIVAAEQLAYMIYTSGTTGKPKGVMIEHSDVVRLIINDEQLYTFEVGEVWTLFHSLSFDYSVWEMYGSLLTGGKLVIIPQATVYDPRRFIDLLVKEKVTILNQTPAAFYVLSSIIKELQPDLSLKIIIFSAEALHPKKLLDFHRMYPDVRLINMYGITETTVFTMYKELNTIEIETDSRSIGLPIPTLSLYLLDKDQKLCLQGGIGELYVGGQGVARGYLGNEELTQSKFIRLPYIPNQILYRTGDLMRISGSGEMEYIGRADHQVKLRGYRIELLEIEEVMLGIPGIKECMVLSIGEYPNNYLCGFYVAIKEALSKVELQQRLSFTLPSYCVPTKFIQIECFPLTVNGKVLRRELIEHAQKTDPQEAIQPRNDTEQLIATHWSTVLGVTSVNVEDDFFENGGNSLQAAILANALQREMQKEITITDIFRFPTIAALAQLLANRKTIIAIEHKKYTRQSYYPLALAQNRIFLLSQHPNVGIAYNIIGKLKLNGTLDAGNLNRALQALFRRHDVLRSVFTYVKGNPVQQITELEPSIEWVICDELVLQKAVEQFICPFVIDGNQPLAAVAIFKHAETSHTLVFNMHHLICDGLSMKILSKELMQLLQGVELSQTNAQFHDFIMWQYEHYQGAHKNKDEQYWLETFSGYQPSRGLTPIQIRSSMQSFEGAQIVTQVPSELEHNMKLLFTSAQVTPFVGWMAIYNIVLAKLTEENQTVVGIPSSGRINTDYEDAIGMFVNTIPIKSQLGEVTIFKQYVQQLKNTILKAIEHQNYPLDELVEKLSLPVTAGRSPLFDTTFAYEQMPSKTEVVDGLTIEMHEDFDDKATMFDISCTLIESDDILKIRFNYNILLFQAKSIENFARHLLDLAKAIIENPEINLTNHTLYLKESSFVGDDWDEAQFNF